MAPPTDLSKLVAPTRDVVLERTLDDEGNKVVVRVRRLSRTEYLLLLGGFPSIVKDAQQRANESPEVLEALRKKAEERRKNDPMDPEHLKTVQESVALANKLISLSAVAPKFYDGDEMPERADVNVIDDDDKALLCGAVFELSGLDSGDKKEDSDGTKAVADFPPQQS